ncbi:MULTISPECIES: DUF2851 family protein [unclassified Lentimicrobium]|uniref:DUF2851 family protein n=1 Tax=unclassified Lentimicrobium TaxID=2677434 RepID=UPI001558061E|nr:MULTISPECIES: DUF2851 family protein [unclassified Lentimicrobium]NPD44747.1 DUF2851 family protein [Lentimicrobium sp. S6]NPD83397.1 DUF2851 family protein [Lentimicrobium sp. L6]
MTEAFFYYLWRYQLFHTPLFTTDGEDINIIKPGILNTDSGPDFFNAKIHIGETTWVGNVEIHVRSSDWNRHQHQKDPAYNNTILHVVYECDKIVKTQDEQQLKCLELKGKFDSYSLEKYEYLLHNKNWIPCAQQLEGINDFEWSNWLERLAIERLENKSASVSELLESALMDWEMAFFISISGYFGQKINQLPFQILARSTQPNILAKHKDQLFQIEALLFGQAGLLEEVKEGEYHQKLKQEYAFLSKKYKLVPMPKHLWKYMRLRPAAFPDIRIAQLAFLMSRSDFLFSKILETSELKQLHQLFESHASAFWDTHYRFDVPSSSRIKKLGAASRMGLMINAVIPFLFVYGRNKGESKYEDRAIGFLSEIIAEKNQITKKFAELGKKPKNALESQAMIQLKTHYCDFKKCLDCKVGMLILKN